VHVCVLICVCTSCVCVFVNVRIVITVRLSRVSITGDQILSGEIGVVISRLVLIMCCVCVYEGVCACVCTHMCVLVCVFVNVRIVITVRLSRVSITGDQILSGEIGVFISRLVHSMCVFVCVCVYVCVCVLICVCSSSVCTSCVCTCVCL